MTDKPVSSPPALFDRRRIRRRRARAAPLADDAGFLHRRAIADIIDRLETTMRPFPRALVIGSSGLADRVTEACGIGEIVEMDAVPGRLSGGGFVAEEDALPVRDGAFDLVVSVLTLHAVNDVIGALVQIRRALKPDGLFVGVAFGEGTLHAWRSALQRAEVEETNALAARIAPFAAVRQFGDALARAGFAMPVADADAVAVSYRDPAALLRDLQAIGETGALAGPVRPLRRATLARALAAFADKGGTDVFNLVFLTGWAPAPDQPTPKPRGSATASLADAVRGFEAPADEGGPEEAD